MTAIEILPVEAAERELDALAEVLWDCVDGGAGVNFVKPFSMEEARGFWHRAMPRIAAGADLLLVARLEGRICGTVMLGLDTPPNQQHRTDVKKLLVHRRARRKGLARALMLTAEEEARRRGRHLLTLDTQQGSLAEGLYRKLGYIAVGVIPGYALSTEGEPAGCTFFYKDLRRSA